MTLIGDWHGPRHATLLADIPDKLKRIRGLDLPRLDQDSGQKRGVSTTMR